MELFINAHGIALNIGSLFSTFISTPIIAAAVGLLLAARVTRAIMLRKRAAQVVTPDVPDVLKRDDFHQPAW